MFNKPEYMIINENTGFTLYRKLFPGEERWYMEELHRLKLFEGLFWLRLKESSERRQLEGFLNK